MKHNTILMPNTFPLAFHKRNVWKFGMPFRTLACQDKKLACRLAHWHTKLNNWHTFGTLAHLLACWHIRMRSWHAFGTWVRRPRWHTI